MNIKQFENWHKRHPEAIPADNPVKNLRGFIDIAADDIVYCDAKYVNKSKYFIDYYKKWFAEFNNYKQQKDKCCCYDDDFSMTQNWYG